MPVFPRLHDNQLARLGALPVGRKMMADRDVDRPGERLVQPGEKRGQVRVVAGAEIAPGVEPFREAQLDVARGEQTQTEAAVDQGEAGEEGLVAFPADAERPAEAGAEVDAGRRIEHGGTEARRRRGKFTGMHRMNRSVRTAIPAT